MVDTRAPFNPFHVGEIEAQRLAGVGVAHAPLRPFMPDQHRLFFAQLPYVFLATLDADGAPAATMLDGEPGFLSSPSPTSLLLRPRADDRDLVRRLLVPGAPVGLLGIELPTRRRNRANGRIVEARDGAFAIAVDQSFGNCPQYIHARAIEAVLPRGREPLEHLPALDAEALALVARASTLFVASAAAIRDGGVDMSHRGGRPGFVRLEGGELVVPEFRGNNYYNTVGNFLVDPRAALLVVDFETGDLLSIAGRVAVDWSPTVKPDGARFVWRLAPERAWRLRAASPYRWSGPELSPVLARTGDWPA
ncbi:pyridoxamine 5'-phosphate oxidase family protein [Alsobacter sp. KACC 23698]|uniref:Pyridoxamine 5'-phosphate oxidase family protein n=1 Tax=Alsobacter sp. KACC 23698 TaxID=3149229 RepID=A0AAU7JDZ9_9HYPH